MIYNWFSLEGERENLDKDWVRKAKINPKYLKQ